MPLIAAIRGSFAIPFWTIATKGAGTVTTSFPPSISRVITGWPFSIIMPETADTEGIPKEFSYHPSNQ